MCGNHDCMPNTNNLHVDSLKKQCCFIEIIINISAAQVVIGCRERVKDKGRNTMVIWRLRLKKSFKIFSLSMFIFFNLNCWCEEQQSLSVVNDLYMSHIPTSCCTYRSDGKNVDLASHEHRQVASNYRDSGAWAVIKGTAASRARSITQPAQNSVATRKILFNLSSLNNLYNCFTVSSYASIWLPLGTIWPLVIKCFFSSCSGESCRGHLHLRQ